MILKYRCENEECPYYDELREIKPGDSSECDVCGWFMKAEW